MVSARVDLREAVRLAWLALSEAGVADPVREARALVGWLAGLRGTEVPGAVSAGGGSVDTGALAAALARRAGAREPMAYLEGTREFYGLPFVVSPATLIPRADSETLVDAVLARRARGRIADFGTGTGCLLLALLHERAGFSGVGFDRSEAAARVAAGNARALGLAGRAAFAVADWGAALDPGARFDVILANPPYVRSGEVGGLMPEVALHEPRGALDGGADGLDAYRALAPLIGRHLASGGLAALEVGMGQPGAVADLLKVEGFVTTCIDDLSGIGRVVLAEKPFGSAGDCR